jgi:ferritin-like metal-binding protein YciE
MSMENLQELLEDQLKDLYNAENQLLKALPKMAKKSSSQDLKKAFQSHTEETQRQIDRLDEVGDRLGLRLTGKRCAAMEGLIEEGEEVMAEHEDGPMLDAAMIAAAQRVEHYEISAYGTARTLAEHLGEKQVARLLQTTLKEESATDEKLTKIAVGKLLPAMTRGEKSSGRAKKSR